MYQRGKIKRLRFVFIYADLFLTVRCLFLCRSVKNGLNHGVIVNINKRRRRIIYESLLMKIHNTENDKANGCVAKSNVIYFNISFDDGEGGGLKKAKVTYFIFTRQTFCIAVKN